MASSPSPLVAALTAQLKRYPNLDAQAVLAIAAHEGLSGGIGDPGTSYGPFQLHKGGAYPSSAPQDPTAANQWAWSPEGLNYALQHIQGVAGGLTGLPAIQAISTRFERPANPQAEIADAARRYGVPYSGGGTAPAPGIAAATGTASPLAVAAVDPAVKRRAFAQSLLQGISSKGQLSSQGLLTALQARRNA